MALTNWGEVIEAAEASGTWAEIADNLIPSLFNFPEHWGLSLREMREIHEAMTLDGSSVGYNPYRERVGLKPLFELWPREEGAPIHQQPPSYWGSEMPKQTCLHFRPVSYKTMIAYMRDGTWVYPTVS